MRISDWSSDVCSSDLVAKASHAGQYSAQPTISRIFVKSFVPILLHGKAWQRDRRFEDANLFGLEQSGQPGGRRQDEFGLFGEMRAQQEALGHDCDILRSDNLAEQLLDVLMNVAQMPAVDQAMPRRLESVQREASVGEMGSRRSEEHTSELQSLMRISYAVFCLKKKKKNK